MDRLRLALAILLGRLLPEPPRPALRPAPVPQIPPRPAPPERTATDAAREERLASQEARDDLAAEMLRLAAEARDRSRTCPASHQDGWIERVSTYMRCAAMVRGLRPERRPLPAPAREVAP